MLASLVSNSYSAFHPPAKAKSLSQSDRDCAAFQSVIIVANLLDQTALISRLHYPSYLSFVSETLAVVVFRLLERSFKSFSIHAVSVEI